MRRIGKSNANGENDNDFADIQVPVIPYEKLAPPPGGIP